MEDEQEPSSKQKREGLRDAPPPEDPKITVAAMPPALRLPCLQLCCDPVQLRSKATTMQDPCPVSLGSPASLACQPLNFRGASKGEYGVVRNILGSSSLFQAQTSSNPWNFLSERTVFRPS